MSYIPELMSIKMEIKHENLEGIMIHFRPVFLFLFSDDFPSVLNKEISFLKGPAAEHTST